jgi:putative ABC transport system substrate-binding protein
VIKPRSLLAVVFLAALLPMSSYAEQSRKTYRIAMLERESVKSNLANVNAFRQGLRELGYIEGLNLLIEYRSAEGRDDAYPALCAEAVRLKVDLILGRGTPTILACKRATTTIPILMVGAGNPVEDGLIASFARPAGNVTGFSASTTELSAKRLEILREMFPRASNVAALMNMSNPNLPSQWKQLQAAAQAIGIRMTLFDVRQPDDLKVAFQQAQKQRLDSIYVALDTLTQTSRKPIADLALKHQLPTITAGSEYVEAGCLVSYGPKIADLYRRGAVYVDKILKGAKPGDIPVEQPTMFELAINLKTAKALNLAITPSLLFRADKVIE